MSHSFDARQEDVMAYYMIQAAFTPESWAKLVKNPQDRREAIRPMIEKLDGRLEGYWFGFGEYDAIVIAQVPDNVSAAALSLAAAAGGALKAIKTTPLMTMEEAMQAMRKAGTAT
jgi:uncharacterized protein with GYD domain